MSQIYWPDEIIPAATDVSVLDMVGRFPSALNGVTSTVGRPGSRLRMAMSFKNLNSRNRLKLQATLSATRGGTKPIRCKDHTYTMAGGFTGADLITNPTFANGTTGYTFNTSHFTGAAHERTLRCTRVQNTAAAVGIVRTDALTVTAYRPYVGRALVMPGKGPYDGLRQNFGTSAFGSEYGAYTGLSAGMLSGVIVPSTTTLHYSLGQGIGAGLAGDYLDFAYLSVQPCALVDNAPNSLLQTNTLSTSPWTSSNASATANQAAGPDGATTLESINETTANASHIVYQTVVKAAATVDLTARCYAKASTRSQIRLQIGEQGTNFAVIDVSLSDGSIIQAATAFGTVTNARGAVVPMGNGVYEILLTATIPATITTSNTFNIMPMVAGDPIYIGTGTNSAIYAGGATYGGSQNFTRYRGHETGFPETAGVLQNLGGGIYTKGWPASTSNLLLAGDQVEIGGQLIILDGPVNSDAAGRAFLPFPSIRVAPVDNEPVIVISPLGKWIPEEPENGWTNVPGIFSDAELALIESG